MSPHVAKLVHAFDRLPLDFTEDEFERVIVSALEGIPLSQWEEIADAACDQYCNERRDRIALWLASFQGTMH